MPAPALLLAVAKRRASMRIVSCVAGILVPVLIMAMCGGLALVASASTSQNGTTTCLTTASTATDAVAPPGTDTGLSIPSASGGTIVLSAAQIAVARDYIGVGEKLGLPDSAFEIAIMMSLQESGLKVLANSNIPASLSYAHDGVGSNFDSIGTAQQRPSAGWGSVSELMNPIYDAEAFYGGPSGPNHGSPPGLLDIPGWTAVPMDEAAQAVQGSAFPELYAQWQGDAQAIVVALKTGTEVQSCSSNTSTDDTPADDVPTLPSNLSQLRSDIIHYAEEGVGGAYVWGGTAFKAWDCSGYVQWVYAQVGIKLPRTEQWLAGTPTSNPQPGDLVAQNPDGPDQWGHVGIYAGNGMMFSALNPSVGTLLHPVAWNTGTKYFVLIHG